MVSGKWKSELGTRNADGRSGIGGKIRRVKPLFLATSGFILTVALAAQVHVNYHDQDFTLSGFDTFNATLENSGIGFNGAGKPLRIEIRSSGTTLTGTNAEGTAQRGPGQAYFLHDATVSGGATLNISGSMAQQFAEEQAKAAGKTAPVPPDITTTNIQSDQLKYTGTPSDGRVDFAGAVTIDSTTNGSSTSEKAKTATLRVLHLTGSSGFVTLSTNAGGGNNSLQTGQIAGPVNYSGRSETTIAGQQPDVTTFEGKSDALSFDFTKEPRTMTLTGHVTLSAKGTAATGDISADTVVVTLDQNLKPIKVDITGSPATTTLRQQPPAGGSKG